MSLFRRRRAPVPSTGDSITPAHVDAQVRSDLEQKARLISGRLEHEEDVEQRIALLNELAAISSELGDIDGAITHYEASMAIREQFGPAYTGLLDLYNDKLKAAAQAKDDAGIQHWTTKLDELMALSKRVMRSQY